MVIPRDFEFYFGCYYPRLWFRSTYSDGTAIKKSNGPMNSAESVLLPIQFAQQEHDQFAHRDILNLDTQTQKPEEEHMLRQPPVLSPIKN